MEDINCEGLPHIRVLAGENTDGPVYETLPARQFVDVFVDLARGDIVSIADPLAPAEVLKRGGNFCIQIYADDVPQEAVDQLERDVQEQLGGTMDGQYKGNLTFSVPGHHGIYSVNGPFDAFRTATGVEWYFANIYVNLDDDDDETLLNWWVDM